MGDHGVQRDPLRACQDVVEAADQHREPGLVVQVLVDVPGGERADLGGDRQDIGRDTVPVQMRAVTGDDALPVRVEVGLRHHEGDLGAQVAHRPQCLQLGVGQLPRGVGHEEHGVRLGQCRHCPGLRDRPQPADARGVDEHETGREQRSVDPDGHRA